MLFWKKSLIALTDARVITRLKQAGYNIAAIVNMEEGALGAQTDNPWFGKTFNPLKAGYTPGGSSGGSAAAVGAGQVDIALGTDTMGSVRIPSAYCGLWGFKPSYDPDMLTGVMPLSPTLDTVGVHGRGDIAVLDWGDKVECEPDVKAIFDQFVSMLGKLPTTDLGPYRYGNSRRAGLILSEVEGFAYHAPMLEIEAAYMHVKILRQAKFPKFILMPTTPQTAFRFGETVPIDQADFTAFANLADRPAIAFPIGKNADGLPISAQLIGPRGREADLVATLQSLNI